MALKLDNEYRIETDENNFVLVYELECYNEKTDKNYLKTDKSYFPKMSQALDKYLNDCIRPLGDIVVIHSELIRIEAIIKKIQYDK